MICCTNYCNVFELTRAQVPKPLSLSGPKLKFNGAPWAKSKYLMSSIDWYWDSDFL